MTDADKRDRIIAAAYEVLSEKGYDKASTKEIANTAGVAQGLINYYFSSKDLLFAEVFRRQTINFCASFDHLIEPNQSELNPESILKLLEVSKKRALEEQDWFRLRQELFAIGLRNDAARETLREMLQTERQHISARVAEISGLPRSFTDVFASIFYSVFEGLSLQKVADSTFEYDQAYAMVAEMLGAYYEKLSKQRES
ncbi:TetR/AcrR family transcriptional regulator [Cohnella endophytica]|uniref:TetR/AcrR family transcriptional regulator n=1 Tax=Cohnella endophytica TaxID=2419778 RepID=A0A494XK02_9BACL|nr:TetR/AcrR family transcriptional regulator [Cohnella endophytica]RKP50052.1 TetR/AcrR family transcriptional regulator [Cohnella endophytica]